MKDEFEDIGSIGIIGDIGNLLENRENLEEKASEGAPYEVPGLDTDPYLNVQEDEHLPSMYLTMKNKLGIGSFVELELGKAKVVDRGKVFTVPESLAEINYTGGTHPGYVIGIDRDVLTTVAIWADDKSSRIPSSIYRFEWGVIDDYEVI